MNVQELWSAFGTIYRKEVVRFMRIWTQTLLPPAITISLYFVIFGTFIGSQVSDIEGFSYMAFIVPGLVMMSVITNSFSNVATSFFGSKFQRSIDELLVSPTPSWVIIAGFVAGGASRGLAVGIVVLLLSMFFTQLTLFSIPYILVFIILTAVVFALGGLLNGVFSKKFDDVAIIPTFVLTPLTYLGGVFYSIKLLPEFWQVLSKFNPILYMVNGFRFGFLGISDINVHFALGMLIVFSVVLFAANYMLIERGIGLRE